MKLSRKQKETISRIIDWWDDQGLLQEGQGEQLKKSIELKTLNWKKIASYLMGLAILSIIVSFFTLVAEEWILELFEPLFEISDVAILILLITLTVFFYLFAWRLFKNPKQSRLSIETLLVLGSISCGGSLALIADAYTQYFVFLWEPLHPALFFSIMGLSFWLLGRKAEKLKH